MRDELEQQQFFMRRALQLGERGRLTAPPNPWVGCVIAKEGKIVGEGYHEEPGKAHAEVSALKKAGSLAAGATAYVTLEPCAHWGRTPPCITALIEAKIKKVVIPFLDPDVRVSGKGVSLLKEHGVELLIGVCQEEAEKMLAPYLHHRKTGEPFCVLKAALSLDGKIAAVDGSSQWITQEEARRDAHFMRAQSQAILIGSGTALRDQPRLTVRLDLATPYKQPLRVVVDAQGRVAAQGPLFDQELSSTLMVTTARCCEKRRKEWESRGAEVIILSAIGEHVDLQALVRELGKRGVVQLLVEGGSEIATAFFQQKLVQRLVLYFGGSLLGVEGKPFLNLSVGSLHESPRLMLESLSRLGNDIRVDYRCRG